MFEEHFRLTSLPFQLVPDPRFYFASSTHTRALAHLTYGLSQGDGFIVITGEVGAGKTTLVEHLLSGLEHGTHIAARIATTQLSPHALLRMIMLAFNLPYKGNDKSRMLNQFEEFFQHSQSAGQRLLLVVDEVQNLPFSTLEELRMLSNLATGHRTPLQTCLIGQPQFRQIITSAKAEQLRQRIFTSYHLGELSDAEIGGYIEHRLRVAAWSGDPTFDVDAYPAIFAHTKGIPRRINSLCSRLLLQAYLNDSHIVTASDVHQVAGEWHAELGTAGAKAASACATASSAGTASVAERLTSIECKLNEQQQLLQRAFALLRHTADAPG
jgi:putative secretion ATPase (PEP-CTERM system associated)